MGGRIVILCAKFTDDPISSLDFSFIVGVPLRSTKYNGFLRESFQKFYSWTDTRRVIRPPPPSWTLFPMAFLPVRKGGSLWYTSVGSCGLMG